MHRNNPTLIVLERLEKSEALDVLLGDCNVICYGTAEFLGSGRRYENIFLRWPSEDYFLEVMTQEEFTSRIVVQLSCLLTVTGKMHYV